MKKHRIKSLIAVTALSLLLNGLLSGCESRTDGRTEATFWQMDSAITVRLYGEADATAAALTRAGELLQEKDALLSTTQADSEIARFNAADAGEIALSDEVRALLARALELEAITDGAFTVTVEPLLACWEAAEKRGALPTEELAAALANVGGSHLTLTDGGIAKDATGVALQLGGIGKGYALDAVKAVLTATPGVTGGILSCTSNVTVFGEKPDGSAFYVAIRNPAATDTTLPFRLRLDAETALSVSGDYERYFTVDGQTFSHILNPATGYPPENGLRSVAVLAADATTADALSTALMVLGEEKGNALRASGVLSFEALYIYEDSYSPTTGFAERMQTAEN